MGRRRKQNKHLPRGVRLERGSYFFRGLDRKRINLARDFAEAMAKFGLLAAPKSLVTFGDLLDRYARDIVPKKAPRTQLDNQRYIAQMRKTFGDWPIEDVTKAAVRDFRDKLGERSGAVQANRHLEVLKHLFRIGLAEWDAKLDRDVLDVKKLEMAKRERHVSSEEFEAVYAKAPENARIAMDLGLLTGLRRGDLLSLTRSDCKDDGIHCRTSKTGVPLIFEWTPELTAIIDRAKRLKPHFRQHLIATRQGEQFTGDGFGAVFRRAVRRAVKAKSIAAEFTFNDLRSKSASDSQDLQEASERLGHTTTATTLKHYVRKPRTVKPLR